MDGVAFVVKCALTLGCSGFLFVCTHFPLPAH